MKTVDGSFGVLNATTGKWTGMIGMLLRGVRRLFIHLLRVARKSDLKRDSKQENDEENQHP